MKQSHRETVGRQSLQSLNGIILDIIVTAMNLRIVYQTACRQ